MTVQNQGLANEFKAEMNHVVEFTVSCFLHAIDPINVTMAYRATSLLLKDLVLLSFDLIQIISNLHFAKFNLTWPHLTFFDDQHESFVAPSQRHQMINLRGCWVQF